MKTGIWACISMSCAILCAVEDSRPSKIIKQEYASLAAGGTIVIASISGPGAISMIQLSMALASGPENGMMLESKLNVRCDGAESPGQQMDLGAFFHTHGTPLPWHTDRVALTTMDANRARWAAYRRTEIPFNSGCIVEVTNSNAAAAAGLWSQVYYRAGLSPVQSTGNRRKVWRAQFTPMTRVSQYDSIDLLPQVSGRGEIESVYLLVSSDANYSYLEGNVDWTIDGDLNSVGGTEDYFGGNYYWTDMADQFRTDTWGVFALTKMQDRPGAYAAGMYRYHRPQDPLPFNTSAKLTWHNGQIAQGAAPGSVGIVALVTYWLDQ